jgi:site-specific recombinase XerC
MYGAGLRLLECAELRIKDVDVAKREIRVRDGKGRKDRVTVIPARWSSRWPRSWRRPGGCTKPTSEPEMDG